MGTLKEKPLHGSVYANGAGWGLWQPASLVEFINGTWGSQLIERDDQIAASK